MEVLKDQKFLSQYLTFEEAEELFGLESTTIFKKYQVSNSDFMDVEKLKIDIGIE